MAAKKDKTSKKYLIEVIGNPRYNGEAAGGVQFAYGKAEIMEGRMVEWYREHDGYKVTEITEAETGAPDA
jgi:hypothetical protein